MKNIKQTIKMDMLCDLMSYLSGASDNEAWYEAENLKITVTRDDGWFVADIDGEIEGEDNDE